MKKVISILCIFYVLISANCVSMKTIYGNKKIETKTFNLEDFDSVDISLFSSSANIIRGEAFKVEIALNSNLFEFVDVYVNKADEKLIIKTKSNVNIRDGKAEIFITMPKIKSLSAAGRTESTLSDFYDKDMSVSLSIRGAGSITADIIARSIGIDISGAGKTDLKGKMEEFFLKASGSTNVIADVIANNITLNTSGISDTYLKGTAEKIIVSVSGSGTLKATELKAKDISCTISGSGNIEIYAETSLKATTSGSATVRYAGNPQKVTLNSSGSAKIEKLE
ncbi:head GIN domain-containing protein [Treponema pedis]|uniref:head GIN domain-containing protein n=1 Tax=Treponema pedis TaxID=409322 RepID=UPI0003FF7CFE|nr:head GIN domain-containing protein [Treponema pedis]